MRIAEAAGSAVSAVSVSAVNVSKESLPRSASIIITHPGGESSYAASSVLKLRMAGSARNAATASARSVQRLQNRLQFAPTGIPHGGRIGRTSPAYCVVYRKEVCVASNAFTISVKLAVQ